MMASGFSNLFFSSINSAISSTQLSVCIPVSTVSGPNWLSFTVVEEYWWSGRHGCQLNENNRILKVVSQVFAFVKYITYSYQLIKKSILVTVSCLQIEPQQHAYYTCICIQSCQSTFWDRNRALSVGKISNVLQKFGFFFLSWMCHIQLGR